MSGLPVALRVKRRRNCAAPSEIILETNTRPATAQEALAASLQQSLAVSDPLYGNCSAQEGPVKKRCRFVLVPNAAATDSSAGAATPEREQLDGPILDIWHTSGVTSAAADARSTTAADSKTAPPSSSLPHMHADDQPQAVYTAMLQQYLADEHQQPLQQQRTYHRPSRRAQRPRAPHSSTGGFDHPGRASLEKQEQQQQGHQHRQQQQQQQQMLPTYMTKGMLQQYGLWQGCQRTGPQQQQQQQQQQQHQQHEITAPSSGPAATAATEQHRGASGPEDAAAAAADTPQQGAEQDYTYDIYMAVELDGGCVWTPHAGQLYDNSPHAADSSLNPAAAACGACLPVIQVWEEELLELQHGWAEAQGAAAADADSEDSNAEDHYANDYPDEEDGSCQDSMDSSGEAEDAGAQRGCYDITGGIGFYQPDSGKGQRSRACGRDESYVGADDSSEYDVDEYESSGDEQGQAGAADGAAWLHKHCPAYAAGATGVAGVGAWRSVLAQRCAPGAGH